MHARRRLNFLHLEANKLSFTKISSYFNRTIIKTMQTTVLLKYFQLEWKFPYGKKKKT